MSEARCDYACATCTTVASFRGDRSRMPEACPTLTQSEIAADISGYLEDENQDIMQIADRTPFDAEGQKRNRVDELIMYAQELGYKRIGIAFCVSMIKEAQELVRRLEAAELEARAVCCRVGAVDYEEIHLTKAHPERFAAICNPIAQGKLLNEAEVDLTVQMGLCIGHDILLQQNSKAPVTTLVVKDRALDHKPILALRPGAKEPAAHSPSKS